MVEDRDQNEPQRVDLAALDTTAAVGGLDRLVGGVMAAAAAELARRRAAPSVWDLIMRWRMPVLATSGALALGALAVFVLVHPVTMTQVAVSASTSDQVTLAEAAGVPSEWVRWTQTDVNPTPAELLAMGQETQ